MKRVFAALMFGGVGKRFGYEKPKQFYPISGRTILEITVEKFYSLKVFNEIIVATNKDYYDETVNLLAGTYDIHIITGGEKRAGSVKRALDYVCSVLKAEEDDVILIHDGARPFVTKEIILENLSAIENEKAVVTAVQARETISISTNKDSIELFYPRSNIYIHQTPQTFRVGILKDAFEKHANYEIFTDEATLVFSSGCRVKYVQGSYENIKVTTKEDLERRF